MNHYQALKFLISEGEPGGVENSIVTEFVRGHLTNEQRIELLGLLRNLEFEALEKGGDIMMEQVVRHLKPTTILEDLKGLSDD